jgi:hypothetical protein
MKTFPTNCGDKGSIPASRGSERGHESTILSVLSQKFVNEFKRRRSEIAQPRAQEHLKKSRVRVILSDSEGSPHF